MLVTQLEEDRYYSYKMYNRGKKKVQEYSVIYRGKLQNDLYLFDMAEVDRYFTLSEEQVLEYIK